MKKLLLILALVLTGASYQLQAQGTVLNAGDLAVIYVETNGTPDGIGFVPFVDLAAGTVIYFTDCGADGAGFRSPACTEGAQQYTAPALIPAGTFVQNPGDAGFTSYTDSRITGSFSLASSGDQVLVFQDSDLGNAIDPAQEPRFIFAINTNQNQFTGDKNDSNETSLPPGLSTTAPISAIAIGSGPNPNDEWDNVVYDGSDGYDFPDIASMKASLLDASNYLGEDFSTHSAAYTTALNALSGNLLPVELINFSGQANAKGVELRWSTASEKDNKYFSIEKSFDGRRFSNIGYVEGNGNSFTVLEYDFLDANPSKGWSYYRLKQVDFNGSFAYSNTIAVRYDIIANEVNMFPNPASNELNLQINDAAAFEIDGEARVQIYNATKQMVKELHLGNGFNGATNFSISELPTGIYMVRLQVGTQEFFEKLVISK